MAATLTPYAAPCQLDPEQLALMDQVMEQLRAHVTRPQYPATKLEIQLAIYDAYRLSTPDNPVNPNLLYIRNYVVDDTSLQEEIYQRFVRARAHFYQLVALAVAGRIDG